MELVYREYGGRWVVDRRRQRSDGNIDHNTKCERGILLHGSFGSGQNRRMQRRLVDRARTAVQLERRFIHSNKIANLRHEFDDATRSFGLSDEQLEVDRKNNARCPLIRNDTIRDAELVALIILTVGTNAGVGIDRFDDFEPISTDV